MAGPPARVDEPPVLARSADALLYHEARHPWSLGERVSALYASRLASAVLFRWHVDGAAAALPPAEAKRFPADVRRFARQRLGHRSLRRVAGAGVRLGPAGWRTLAHVADRSFARRVPPRDVVQEPIGDLVLTTGLPAAALQAGLGEATRAARRWRRRQIGAAVAAVLIGGQRSRGRSCGTEVATIADSDAEETELDEDGTVTQEQPPAPIAVDDTVDTPMATPVEIAVTGNDAGFTDEAEVVLDEPPTSGEARIQGRVVTYVPDAEFAGTDRFTYRLADGDARSDPATVTVRVLPTVLISDVETDEPFAGQPYDLIMQVELTNPFPETVIVTYATAGISTTEGSDFGAATGSLTFAPGQTVAASPCRSSATTAPARGPSSSRCVCRM